MYLPLSCILNAGLFDASTRIKDTIIDALRSESIEEIRLMSEEILRRAGLLDFL